MESSRSIPRAATLGGTDRECQFLPFISLAGAYQVAVVRPIGSEEMQRSFFGEVIHRPGFVPFPVI